VELPGFYQQLRSRLHKYNPHEPVPETESSDYLSFPPFLCLPLNLLDCLAPSLVADSSMTNWHDPALEASQGRSFSSPSHADKATVVIYLSLTVAVIKLTHVVAGVYM
jgi:hypothetical protein